jgi:hypothetical protein
MESSLLLASAFGGTLLELEFWKVNEFLSAVTNVSEMNLSLKSTGTLGTFWWI